MPGVAEFTPAGVPTGKAYDSLGLDSNTCPVVFDSHGYAYRAVFQYPVDFVHRYDPSNNFADLGETGFSYKADAPGPLEIDPATDDLYAKANDWQKGTAKIVGVRYSDPPVKGTPFEVLADISSSASNQGLAFDSTGQWMYVSEIDKVSMFHREPPTAPFGQIPPEMSQVRSFGTYAHSRVTSGGAEESTYRFEYGTDTSYGQATAPLVAPYSPFSKGADAVLTGLTPGTTYHIRLAATNSLGTTFGPDSTFATYPSPPGGPDPCPNALARKQTAARALPDCRAFELVSAADSGGYDVESFLAPGQTPFPGFPLAKDRLLYATHSGAVPGPWKATNKGPDPYLATRGSNGWSTDYLGLPSDLNPAAGSFSSVLGEADSALGALAFAGAGLCSPCFSSGLETGIPVRLPSGQLVQGMSGSLAAGVPASAKPEGKVAKYLSADGAHLLFASKYAFEPGANTGGDLTVYDRNLTTQTTQIASTDPGGAALTGTVSGLDVSRDGSRIVTAKQVSVDPQGNEYVHPYLHRSSSPNSVDLAPGTTSGVLFAGMTADGSRLFFTTADKLIGADTDTSADLYEADVDGAGNFSLDLLTPGTSGSCNPVANSNGAHWNTTGAAANCDAVAIAGGGGVASSSGTVYFLSPEQFGGQGSADQPNLYLAQPGGSPTFVATLEPNNPLVLNSVKANAVRKTADFQTTASGNFAAFTSALEMTGVHTFGFLSVFRFDAASGQLVCASCDVTGTSDASLAGDAELPPDGLGLIEDGRVFFTTRFPLVLNDANGRKDVYQWTEGKQHLLSSGKGPFDSALLTVSADGTDAFFFTQEALAPEEDRNGAVMRIYDARAGGGFFKLPAEVPCAASDECHGPGTAPAPAPPIRSSGPTTQGNFLTCAKNRVKRRGKCVKRQAHNKKKQAKKRDAKTNGKRGGRHA
jgi:hypothetical protein